LTEDSNTINFIAAKCVNKFDVDETHAHACMHNVGGTEEERVFEREGGTKGEGKIGAYQKV
jgi:hypothetical protein